MAFGFAAGVDDKVRGDEVAQFKLDRGGCELVFIIGLCLG